ncbi:hypothetical protein B1C78_00590 [Thioalkalivibrio denitrificans]|uniref:Uncharacterized protein n=1 Tax=Thioalkalivibrio denitrificans TaxID=108003 RepID=A0A1V3NV59_9GAMM|nr:hypothetical protein [Thioalkalivibrio denitrificans]OOG28864.1 hypothetical protein B1C78_00590 [Thioalkalivibrio denitrificans]
MTLDVDLKPLAHSICRMYGLPSDDGRFVVATDHVLHPGVYTLCAALAVAEQLWRDHFRGLAVLPLRQLDDEAQGRLGAGDTVSLAHLMSDSRFRVRSCTHRDAARLGLDFDVWCDAYADDLWATYHETGAHYENPDYERWLERSYARHHETS